MLTWPFLLWEEQAAIHKQEKTSIAILEEKTDGNI